jgi:hypothetical protein
VLAKPGRELGRETDVGRTSVWFLVVQGGDHSVSVFHLYLPPPWPPRS